MRVCAKFDFIFEFLMNLNVNADEIEFVHKLPNSVACRNVFNDSFLSSKNKYKLNAAVVNICKPKTNRELKINAEIHHQNESNSFCISFWSEKTDIHGHVVHYFFSSPIHVRMQKASRTLHDLAQVMFSHRKFCLYLTKSVFSPTHTNSNAYVNIIANDVYAAEVLKCPKFEEMIKLIAVNQISFGFFFFSFRYLWWAQKFVDFKCHCRKVQSDR